MELPEDYRTKGFDKFVGLTILDASGDAVHARVQVRPDLHQPYGIVHGGVYCTLVESCASIGGAL